MRDEFYRSFCDTPSSYDAVINWIRDNNKAAATSSDGAEEFACRVVNDCIRSVVFGDCGAWCSTGMCLAVCLSTKEVNPEKKKVVLAIKL